MMLTINNKAVSVHYGMLAVSKFYEKYSKVKKGDTMTTAMLIDLILFGIENWYDKNEKDCEITRDEVYEWIEVASLTEPETIKAICQKFEDSQYIKALAGIKTESKKKLTSRS